MGFNFVGKLMLKEPDSILYTEIYKSEKEDERLKTERFRTHILIQDTDTDKIYYNNTDTAKRRFYNVNY